MHVISAVLLLFFFTTSPLFAANPQSSPVFREGVHYFALPEAVIVEVSDKIEVAEVFWYGCSHCFHFEPAVLEWQKNMAVDVNFVYVPAMWSREMEAHARAFYAARRLNILEDAHQAIYNAINIDGNRLGSSEEVGAFFAQFGVDEEEVSTVFSSPDATDFLKTADAKARAYQISGTPQLVVHGRYRVQASQYVPRSQMFNVVDYLLEKIRTEQAESTDEESSNEKALL